MGAKRGSRILVIFGGRMGSSMRSGREYHGTKGLVSIACATTQ